MVKTQLWFNLIISNNNLVIIKIYKMENGYGEYY